MNTKDCRPPNLGDAMILIAATAAGVAGMQNYFFYIYEEPFWDARNAVEVVKGAICWVAGSLPLWFAWSLGVFAIRLRRPRPTRRRLFREYGAAAGLVTALAGLAASITTVAIRASNALFFQDIHPTELHNALIDLPTGFGVSVAAAWCLLASLGIGRAEPNWIDRAGRLLGAFWIAWAPFGVLVDSSRW